MTRDPIKPIRWDGKTPTAWIATIELARGPDGERRQTRKTFYGNRREALAAYRQHVADVAKNPPPRRGAKATPVQEPGAMLVKDHLEVWLAQTVSDKRAYSTIARYRELVDGFLKPQLGELELRAVTPKHVNDAITAWRSQKRRDGRKGALSDRTIRHAFVVLKTAFKFAVFQGELDVNDNPCARVKAPVAARARISVLDENDAAKLLEGLRDTDLHVPALVALTTGLRRGELLGLTWDAVDLEHGRLHVRQSLEKAARELRFKAPKTERSERTVGLPAVTIEALRRHRADQREIAKTSGRPFEYNRHAAVDGQPQSLVFPTADGRPWDPEAFTKRFGTLVRRRGLPAVTVHGLRHSFATITLRSGTAMRVASELLGHSSIGITADTYVHVLPDQHTAAASELDKALSAAIERRAENGDKSVTNAS